MSFKILEKNGVDNENIDGAAFNNFSAGGRDGIVAGVLSECSLSLSGNVIGIAPGELILHGFRVKITETETFSNSSVPVSAEKYQIIAQIVVSDNNDVVFSFLIRSPATLIQENIFDNNRGTYQIEIGTYRHNPDGSISELTRTVQVFYADIHKSAEEAKAASKEAAASAAAAQNAAKDAAQAASIAIADYITHTKNGAAVGEVDTLAGAKAEVEVQSKNLFDLNADKYWGSADITERTGSTFTVSGQAGTWVAAEFILPEMQNKTLTVSGEWITSGSNVGGLRVQWITQNGIAVGDTIAETYISGQAATGTVPKKPDNAKYLGFFVYSNTDGTVTGSTSVTYENVQIEIGETATAYTPYLPTGTAVEVNACGKNLFDENGVTSTEGATFTELTAEQVKVTATTEIPSGNAGYAGVAQKNIKAGQTVTINASWTTSASANKGRIAVYWKNANIFIGQQLYSNTPLTVTIPNSTNENDVVYFYFYVATGGGSAAVGDEVTYTNITVNLGDKDLGFSTPVSATYQSAIGETIEVEQYGRITNIFTNTAGASLAVQFKISTQLYLDRFGLIEEGLFANRPTDISEQSRVYIATDRFDNSRYTYLKGGVDGSVTENWTEIVNYGQDNLQTKAKELVPAINEVNVAAGTALLNIPKSAEETGAFISGNNTLAGAKAEVSVESKNLSNIPNGTTNIVTVQNGIFTVNGSYTENSAPLSTETFLKAGTYTFSYHYISGSMTAVEGADNEFMVRLGNRNYYSKWGYFYRDINNYNQDFSKTVEVTEDGYGGLYVLFGPTTIYNELVCTFQLERGKTATAFTPYLPAGTAAEVLASNSNLISADIANTVFDGVTCTFDKATQIFTLNGTKGTATGSWTTGYTNELSVTKGQTYIIQSEILGGTYPADVNTGFYYYVAGHSADPDWQIVCNVIKSPTNVVTIKNDGVFDRFYVYISQGTYENFQFRVWLAHGLEPTAYIPHEDNAYPSTVGETIEVEQYDRITNIYSNTTGAAVSTQFLQSTRYELDTKPVSLAGTYAERPTGTYPYVVLYTATDRSGETYRLEANADGSVSANWVKINGMFQHNIVISPDGLTYFSVTLFSVEDYKYSLNDLVKWLDQKGFNANGKDYTNVSGIIKPESEVLIVSHIKVLDGNLTVAASSAVTGNISENTISNVVSLNDTVI